MNENISTKNLINGLRLGKSWAFEQVYRDIFYKISSFIRANSGTQSDAKDIFQEALIVLVHNLRKRDFELPESKLAAYLQMVSRNIWLKKLRDNKIKLQEISESEKELESFDEELLERKKEYEERHIRMSEALNELDEACRQVIVGFYYKKLSMEEIAAQLDYTYAFVRVKKHKCMKKLKELCQNKYK